MTTQNTAVPAHRPLCGLFEAAGLSPEQRNDGAGSYVMLTLADTSEIIISATTADGADLRVTHGVDQHRSWQACLNAEPFPVIYDSEGEGLEYTADTAALAEAVIAYARQYESALTEADVLRGALSMHGLTAYSGGEGGVSWLVVPFNRHTSEDFARLEPHFLISSGEDAHRPMAQHDEPWSAALYDGLGDYVDTVDGAPAGMSLAEDSAHCARVIAEYIAAHRSDWITPASTGLRVVPDEFGTMQHYVYKGARRLGVIFDETAAGLARGGWAAWSPKTPHSGDLGFFHTKEEAALAIARTWGLCLAETAQWRTLKAITTPFFVYGEVLDDGRVRLARDRQRLTGTPIEVVRLTVEAGSRYGHTASGQRIYFGGTATKVWVA